jgi:hypothetical protein
MTSNLDSAFWHEDFGFLLDRSCIDVPVVPTSETKAFRENRVAEICESSGRLPNLNGAPVASWFLPRLVEVSRGGIYLDDGEHLNNDGGDVCLYWVAFTKTLKPRSFFKLHCYSNRITMDGTCMPNTEPADLVAAFLAPLLENSSAIRVWRVSVRDTDPPNAPGTFGRSYVFGWDGIKFLGTREYE